MTLLRWERTTGGSESRLKLSGLRGRIGIDITGTECNAETAVLDNSPSSDDVRVKPLSEVVDGPNGAARPAHQTSSTLFMDSRAVSTSAAVIPACRSTESLP